jgi:hypothetical protein
LALLLACPLVLSHSLEASSATTLGLPSLAPTAEDGHSTSAETSSLGGRSSVVNDREGGFVFGGLHGE